MRNEGAFAAKSPKTINMTFTHTLNRSRTCKARAAKEVHGLHAFGEHDLVDGTCGREGDEREKEKVRNEEACAAEP